MRCLSPLFDLQCSFISSSPFKGIFYFVLSLSLFVFFFFFLLLAASLSIYICLLIQAIMWEKIYYAFAGCAGLIQRFPRIIASLLESQSNKKKLRKLELLTKKSTKETLFTSCDNIMLSLEFLLLLLLFPHVIQVYVNHLLSLSLLLALFIYIQFFILENLLLFILT